MIIHTLTIHMFNLPFKNEITNLQKETQYSMGDIFYNQSNCMNLVFY